MPKLAFGTKKRYADLPLHYGQVPPWLAQRMSLLGGAITESIVIEYGRKAFMSRLSDPMWFQALGCVLGMDWHSSGITTSVMGALKKALNPRFNELGIYICGGKGKHSRQTPEELFRLSDRTGLNGNELVRSSKLTAKVDNNAIQDGFQIYLHSFVVSAEGEWAVVQQGMNDHTGMARRYHWLSETLESYIQSPHTFIYGKNQGLILNLTDENALETHKSILTIAQEDPVHMLPEIRKIIMPRHHDVRISDVNLKRLGSVLALAHEKKPADFESLLLLEGVGPRTIQSLALVSEVIHGTSSRFTDPARFSFAHGGKDGHPFPVPTKVYDETIHILQHAVERSKLGYNDKSQAIRRLNEICLDIEENFEPDEDAFDKVIENEWKNSHKYGGRTVYGKVPPPKDNNQLSLF
jgi:hypothetical protein